MQLQQQKSRIRDTKNLSTDADSRTDTILERLRDLPIFLFFLSEVAKLQSHEVAKLQSCKVAKLQSREVAKLRSRKKNA